MGLNVLHVAHSSEYGLGRYLANLAAAEQEHGWRVTLAGDPAGSLPGVARDTAAVFVPWRAGRDLGPGLPAEIVALARVVAGVRPDVVHLHSSKAGLAGRLAVRGRRPTIFQPHAWSFYVRPGAAVWERFGARWADVVLCGSEGERDAGERAGIRAEWRVVPNAVDTERFAPGDRGAARLLLGLPLEGGVVVCAARLAVHQKGQDVLLAAWPRVRAAVPGARLVLVGDGPDRARLEAGAPEGVWFAGSQDDVAPWYHAADVVVQPSRYETLSLSVLEAMACGRPVVVTEAVGTAEALGNPGAVVPQGDPVLLAAAVVERLRNPDRAAVEGTAARRRVQERYGIRAWRECILGATAEVAARRRPLR